MGVISHNAVIATTWNESEVGKAKEFISGCGDCSGLFCVNVSRVNGCFTIVLCPDGAYESTDISDNGDELRRSFISFLNERKYPDGSSPWKWVEVKYGELGQEVKGNN